MPSRNAITAFAEALLTPQNIGIAEEIVKKHFDAAVNAKDTARIIEMTAVLNLVAAAKATQAKKTPAPTTPEKM